MILKDQVIRSQLLPPRQRKGVLRRPRLESRLLAVLDYPLTLVHAATGYGKSTALAALAGLVDRLAWYTITEPDRDPLLFLAHLICSFERLQPAWCEPALRLLEGSGGRVTPAALTPLLNALTAELDGEAVLVMDDYHLVANVPDVASLVQRLVDLVPPRLHVVLSSRQVPPLAALTRWQVKGQMLAIGRAELAFTADEIEALFRQEYHHPITPEQAQALAAETEGWAIALQMVWQSIQSGAAPGLDAVLGRLPSTLETLFDYLAQDVLAGQPAEIQRFLLTTSVLREMNPAACDHLLNRHDSAEILHQLHEGGLFVVSMSEGVYRYHRLFHDFLRAHLGRGAAQQQALHHQAAGYFLRAGHPEETIYHLLEAGDHDRAAELVGEIGPRLVEMGRFDSLTAWIGQLPDGARVAHPALDLLVGDTLRLRAQFDEALAHYQAAESRYEEQGNRLGRSRALRGQAQVYLDTIRPLKADSLLEDALHLLEPMEHRHEAATLLDLLAENKLNLGYPDEAQALHHEARLLRAETDPGDIYLEARAALRTGHLAEARQLLERRAEEESQADGARPQRFHRETLLLLSLVCSLQGDADAAERCARRGIAISQRLHSDFVETVGLMRLGHPIQLRGAHPWDVEASRPAEAIACYERAIEQVQAFRVMRTQVEPLWGLCRVYGYGGDLTTAERYATQAVEIAQGAGDKWIGDLIRVTMGASYALHGRSAQAQEWLAGAAEGFGRVGDSFGRAAARLWLALDAWWRGELTASLVYLTELLPLARERGWDSLLVRPTFLGLQDDQAALPLLVEARRRGIEPAYTGRLLQALGLTDAEYHPGYTLSVQTLGRFAVWRGAKPVAAAEWKRDKARQIFELLLTHRGQWFYREQIVEHLWPHLPTEAAERDFKVALNALNRALEPARRPRVPSFFVTRRSNLYGLNPAAKIIVDIDDFERLAASEDMDLLRQAVALYQDDYLPDCLYEDWPTAERQRLRHLYLVTAERLARHLLRARAWDETIRACEAILARDNCWEAAYRLLMRTLSAQGNRAELHAVYQRCTATLNQELGIEPSPATRALFDKLLV
jgi:ATP/maltotriose-dependent transcriptional regulator MalT/DNA-binding SARP family transcriptional activator